MTLAAGSTLGRYRIVRQLGAGAMGEVYLAEDPQIERRLAIKVVRLEDHGTAALHTQLRLRIEREAKAAGRLVHPHVVTLFDAGEVDGVFYLAFEFVDGPDLAARTRRPPPLRLGDIVRIGREAASALDAAHRAGIIHRDIKPSNLLLAADGSLKIADFGIATLVGQGTHLTQSGSLIGTPQYISPEQVRTDVPLDGRSDLFSMGAVLYELLAGRRPFEGPSMAALLYAIVSAEPPPLGELRPGLPPRLSAAVMRLLSKDREQRFPTAAALESEFREIERELASEASAPTEDAPGTVPPTRHVQTMPPTVAAAETLPPTLQVGETKAPVRRRGGVALLIVLSVALIAIAGLQFYRTSAKADDRTRSANPGPQEFTPPVTSTTADVATRAPLTENVSPSTPEPPVADVAVPGARVVGVVVTFNVTPQEAAAGAAVKIDGLVRGTTGSVVTLRPGRHEIEVVASGFEPWKVLVDARNDVNEPTAFDVDLRRR